MIMNTRWGAAGIALTMFGAVAAAQSLPAEMKAKAEARAKAYAAWGAAPEVVAAVKAFNAAPPAEAKAMTQEKWKSASVLDPVVRSFSRNALAAYLKTKKDDAVTEIFISGADGTKAAFLAKTTSWSHKGKDKHELPMKGKTWIGPLEVDDSSGRQQFQIAVPVLDGRRPIGSLVVGVKREALM